MKGQTFPLSFIPLKVLFFQDPVKAEKKILITLATFHPNEWWHEEKAILTPTSVCALEVYHSIQCLLLHFFELQK